MARISKDLVAAREAEAIKAFQDGATVKEVNDALFTKYQKRMGLKRIYELRDQVKKQTAVSDEPTPVVAEVVEPATEPVVEAAT
jgi:hypothetical protein